MRKIIYLLFVCLFIPAISYGQGKISRLSTPKPQIDFSEITQVSQPDGLYKGHGYIDLGLQSGTKWATTNFGATSPYDFGQYVRWGSLQAKTSSNDNIEYGEKMSKINHSIAGNIQYDIVTKNWGNKWCIPTADQLQELKKECTWSKASYNGIKGYLIEGPNKKTIFLPIAGAYGWKLKNNGSDQGGYWSATPSDKYTYQSEYLYLNAVYKMMSREYRYEGYPIRPVIK